MITESSLTAYRTLVQPKLGEKQREVLSVFEMNPGRNFSDAELAQELGWTINKITPRRGELVKMKLIAFVEKRHCTVNISPIRVNCHQLNNIQLQIF